MKTNISKILSYTLLAFFLSFTACTKQAIKNKALALSVIDFDNDAQGVAKNNFADQEMQKVYMDFTKMNSKLSVDNVELQGDKEATAVLTVETFPTTLVEEFKTISGKEWKAKADAAKQVKTYNLKLQKVDDLWKITERNEVAK